MQVLALDHVNIRTRNIDATVDFYARAFGLTSRDGPPPAKPEQVRWLCDATGHAVIHLYRHDTNPGPTGPIHHVAFNCSGKAAALERLQSAGIRCDQYEDASAGLSLVYVTDVNGILVELNFPHG